jgi:hypothetical protein
MGVRRRGLDIKTGAAKLKADRAARVEAEAVIQRWNDQLSRGRDMLWSPTIRAALLAGTPWLDVLCPGCGTSRAIDLRTLDRQPAGLGGHAGARFAVLVVYGIGTDAEAAWAIRIPAGRRSDGDALASKAGTSRGNCDRDRLCAFLRGGRIPR